MVTMPKSYAVILAGGEGSRLYPLNSTGMPKVLLPVANKPLLTFPLRMLEEGGITNVLVVRDIAIYFHKHCLQPPAGTTVENKKLNTIMFFASAGLRR